MKRDLTCRPVVDIFSLLNFHLLWCANLSWVQANFQVATKPGGNFDFCLDLTWISTPGLMRLDRCNFRRFLQLLAFNSTFAMEFVPIY